MASDDGPTVGERKSETAMVKLIWGHLCGAPAGRGWAVNAAPELQGLTKAEARDRLARFGRNDIKARGARSWLDLMRGIAASR